MHVLLLVEKEKRPGKGPVIKQNVVQSPTLAKARNFRKQRLAMLENALVNCKIMQRKVLK